MQLAEKDHLEMVPGGFEKLVLLSFYYKKFCLNGYGKQGVSLYH